MNAFDVCVESEPSSSEDEWLCAKKTLETELPPMVEWCARGAVRVLACHHRLTPDQYEEALQEALIEAWEAYVSSPSPHHRVVWRSAWNALRRWWRAERRWQNHTLPLEYPDEQGEWQALNIVDLSAEIEIEHTVLRAELEQLIERLGLTHQERLVLSYLAEGWSQREVAWRLGRSQAWVSWCLATIRWRASGIVPCL